MLDLVLESGLGIFEGLFETFAAGIVFPAVVGAANAVVFDEAIVKRRPAVRTVLADEAVTAAAVAVEQ